MSISDIDSEESFESQLSDAHTPIMDEDDLVSRRSNDTIDDIIDDIIEEMGEEEDHLGAAVSDDDYDDSARHHKTTSLANDDDEEDDDDDGGGDDDEDDEDDEKEEEDAAEASSVSIGSIITADGSMLREGGSRSSRSLSHRGGGQDPPTTTTSGGGGGGGSDLGSDGDSDGGHKISLSGEETLAQVIHQMIHHQTNNNKHEVIIDQNTENCEGLQGLGKLGAYILQNDENTIPRSESQSISKMMQDEEFSLHLSRPTGTGSQQLEMWIKEVNIAVSRDAAVVTQPRLLIVTDEKIMERPVTTATATTTSTGTAQSQSPVNLKEYSTPTATSTTHQQQQQKLQLQKMQRQTLSPVSHNLQDNFSTPVNAISSNNRHEASPSGKAHWRETSPASKNNDNVKNGKERQQSRQTSNTPIANTKNNPNWQEILPPPSRNESIDKHSSFATPRVRNNSKFIMASIEGKYKSLRENLIQENTFDDNYCSSDETDDDNHNNRRRSRRHSRHHQQRRRTTPREAYTPQSSQQLHRAISGQQQGNGNNPVSNVVSAVMTSQEALRMDYNVHDRFSLGVLSTRSSGILTANSWSTASSFESERSANSSYPAKGCGIFLCD